MAHSFQMLVGGKPVDPALYGAIEMLEVEENADVPGALRLTVPVARTATGDLSMVNDPPFQPFANLAVVVTAEGKSPECIFDGYVLSQKLELDQGATSAKVIVFAQDASWLMNLEEKVTEWTDVTDGQTANSIFEDYGFATAKENTEHDSGRHTESNHTLMQRSSDIQFLQQLARRSGKLCRVACGSTAGKRTGYFVTPRLKGEPAVTLSLQAPEGAQIQRLEFEWDVSRPSSVVARAAVFTSDDEDGVDGNADDSGLPLLANRSLSDFSGKTITALLTAAADDANELQLRAKSMLRDGGFFARCTGVVDLEVIKRVMRVGTLARVDGAGAVSSGNYFVWSVRHLMVADAYRMMFVLVRNAVGGKRALGGALGGLL